MIINLVWMKIKFSFSATPEYSLVRFESKILSPDVLKTISPPDPIKNNFANKGVILSGRGPIWLYGFLIHFYHPTLWVATYDPRLNGAVVVESHTVKVKIGDVIPFENKIHEHNSSL